MMGIVKQTIIVEEAEIIGARIKMMSRGKDLKLSMKTIDSMNESLTQTQD